MAGAERVPDKTDSLRSSCRDEIIQDFKRVKARSPRKDRYAKDHHRLQSAERKCRFQETGSKS
jgi:hypothetical protein